MALRVSSPVLVGRGAELGTLLRALDLAAGSQSTTVLVDGEAGIGKTRLVREFADDARASGAVVLSGGCVRLGRDDGLPFAPVTEALRRLLRERGQADVRALLDPSTVALASIVPELGALPAGGPLQDQRPDWAQTRLFQAMLVLLTRLGEEGPAVFVVEDLHWADRSTLDLLTFLARNLRDERVLLVGTYRSDELHRRHPLRPWASELDRLGVDRISLDRLRRDELRGQIAAITGEEPDLGLVEAIEARSGGNPFFVEELLAARDIGGDLPASLRELLLARMGGLSEGSQYLLGVASVAGPVVDHDVLLSVSGLDEAPASDRLHEAVSQHVLVPHADGASTVYAFRHALLQEAIYDDLLPRDRRRLHGAYAAALEALPEPSGAARASHLAALAHHSEAAHELPRALAAWLRAGRAAFLVHAAAEAAHAFSRCLELWDAVPAEDRPADVTLADILHEASHTLSGTGDVEKARDMAARAVELDDGSDPEHAALFMLRLGRTQWLAGDPVTATGTLQQALALVKDRPASTASARVVGGLAGVLMLRSSTRRAVEMSRRAIDIAREVGSREAEAYALGTLSASLADLGECEEGIDVGRQSIELSIELNRADDVHRAYANLSTALQSCGRGDEALEVALEGLEWARQRGMVRLQGAFLQGNAADVLFEQGRWAEAADVLQIDDRVDLEGVALLNHSLTGALLAIHTGRLDDARRISTNARSRVESLHDAQFTGPIFIGLVELALAEGRADDVEGLVHEALRLMSETEDIRHRAELMGLAVRAASVAAAGARASGDAEAATAAAASASAWLDRLRDHVSADATTSRHGLDAAASLATAEAEHAAMEGGPAADAWDRAASAWADLGRPFPVARCRLRQAEALLTAGDRSGGSGALNDAHAAAVRMGAVTLRQSAERLATLARVTLDRPDASNDGSDARDIPAREPAPPADHARPFDLTERELQVLPLLVAGYTNRQIGEAMFISPSTAGVHVSRILGKMSVSSRVEAAAIAVRSGLA